MSKSTDELWPPFGLKITCGPVTLSPVRDADFPDLDALAQAGIHAPTEMPFFFPWTLGSTGAVRLRLLQYHWAQRAEMSSVSWTLETAVRFNGEIVGCQSISTKDYLVTRTGETGSWLGMKHHGQGIGTMMRQALCAFMFDHLDAVEVTSAALVDNPASLAVSRKVGYQENGVGRLKRRDGEMALNQKLVLTAETLNRPEHQLEVEGVQNLREFLGLAP
ncbi:N-acetyltransferase [Cryobacterium sp. MDB1-18-2]|uniref:GNAT family N-acetyltransferase n=1 Tax=unclassified Cryobacterium TaxID=2649013 RepID=UPI00106B0E5C|nr:MULTISPECIES: GNAT family N-acetyltransferase [unclassified Cryobacterium]TFC27544.1 N-acetyltransferase [Cryobacterium sp. MDB1-18-2]TFC37966.1 N-acetyltransferase [Cryobacterium sp. MDB1-18-1]